MRFLLGLATAFLLTTGCVSHPPENEPADTHENSLESESEDESPPSYEDVETLEGDALKDALNQLVSANHRRVGYDRARKILFSDPEFIPADGQLECMYTARKVRPTGSTSVGGFNTEHTWPQSRGASREPAKSDLHHLFPVDARANSSRGNWPFGTVECLHNEGQTCSFSQAGSALGRDEDGKMAFEVRPEKRGDIARAIFYFSVRYDLRIAVKEETALRDWHASDPPDDFEKGRNDAVFRHQNNRNPFIDRPDFVAKISDF